nr:uncharacterized protein LOC120964654 [Aegilops tauschii subsp. strangulata]
MRMEEEQGTSTGAGGSVPSADAGGEGNTSPQHGTDPPSTDQEDIDTIIEEVAKDAEAEAARIAAAAEEAAKAAAGEAAKGPAEEEVANNQPSSPAAPAPAKYLKVGDDLFVRLPGAAMTRAPTQGEVFDDEALATAGLQVVDEPSTSSGGPQEE